MTDKELLELAAKAVGFDSCQVFRDGDIYCTVSYVKDGIQHVSHWNPLNDDGDAFRLAVDLKFKIDIKTIVVSVTQVGESANSFIESCDNNDKSRLHATRRAIVRAAAAIGAQL